MKDEYHLTSTFTRIFYLAITGIMLSILLLLLIVTSEEFFLFFIIITCGLATWNLLTPDIIISKGILTVKVPFQEPVTYPINSITDIRRSFFLRAGMGVITMKNREKIYYMPKYLDSMLFIGRYREHVMGKMKRLQED